MKRYSLDHLAKSVLHRNALLFHRNESCAMAMALAHVVEIDARQSYRDEGYPSMLAFCEHVFELTEQAALKRIRVARVAATHVPKSKLEQLISKRFPKQDVPSMLEAVPALPPMLGDQASPGTPGSGTADQVSPGTPARGDDDQLSSRIVEAAIPRPKVSPLSEDRFALQLTVSRCTHDKLRYAQELLSHQLPSGDLAEVLDRALDALIVTLEKRKFAATSRYGRENRRTTQSSRHIPAHVKREVWTRDGGQCTFVGESGHRCESRNFLEFDHIEEVARGGRASVTGMRLRCLAHNQFEAERTFGAEFMQAKREEAQRVAREKEEANTREKQAADAAAVRAATERLEAEARIAAERRATEARIAAQQSATEAQVAAARAEALDVVPWLRALGFRLDDARRAAAACAALPDASLEDRFRKALAFLAPRATKQDFRRADIAKEPRCDAGCSTSANALALEIDSGPHLPRRVAVRVTWTVEFIKRDSPRGEFALQSLHTVIAASLRIANLTAPSGRGTFAYVDACKAVTGTSTREASQERAGDSGSPVTAARDEHHPRAADRNGTCRTRLGRMAPRERAGARCARQGGGREAAAKLGGTATRSPQR